MTFQIVLVVHVASMLGVFVALTLEWVSVLSMRRARNFEQARDASRLQRWLVPIGVPSTLAVLTTGIWLAHTLSLWSLGWVKIAVPTLVLVGIAGAIVGPRRKRIRAALESGAGSLPADVVVSLRHGLLVGSLWTRSVLLVALVFAMTVKP